MDGDHVGRLLRKPGAEKAVSDALAHFTAQVQPIVAANDGITIYAGGDDVLALLPLTTALKTAGKLREAYLGAFAGMAANGDQPTTSAGLVFAHYGVPLSFVMREAHRLLDQKAKDHNGRDSIAIALHKPSGKPAEWVSAWTLDGGVSALDPILELARIFAEDDEQSSSFLYNLSERYRDLLDPVHGTPLSPKEMHALLYAERLKGKQLTALRPEDRVEARGNANGEVERLLRVCLPRNNHGDTGKHPDHFSIDGALLVRFLADNGIWFDGIWSDGIQSDSRNR